MLVFVFYNILKLFDYLKLYQTTPCYASNLLFYDNEHNGLNTTSILVKMYWRKKPNFWYKRNLFYCFSKKNGNCPKNDYKYYTHLFICSLLNLMLTVTVMPVIKRNRGRGINNFKKCRRIASRRIHSDNRRVDHYLKVCRLRWLKLTIFNL